MTTTSFRKKKKLYVINKEMSKRQERESPSRGHYRIQTEENTVTLRYFIEHFL